LGEQIVKEVSRLHKVEAIARAMSHSDVLAKLEELASQLSGIPTKREVFELVFGRA
jgi:hypothetical protein